jgi:hypothetical protein
VWNVDCTLFDVAVITTLFEITTKTFAFEFTCASFARDVADNHDTASEEVSSLEHIAFLAMSISYMKVVIFV